MGFDRPDIVRQAGYSEGDVIPVATIGHQTNTAFNTTSTSFVTVSGAISTHTPFADLVPAAGTTVVGLAGRFTPGTDETMTGRLWDNDNSTELVTTGDITAVDNAFFGWTEVSSPPSGVPLVVYQHKTSPGVNSSQSRRIVMFVGVQL